jgi:hypothetical protein
MSNANTREIAAAVPTTIHSTSTSSDTIEKLAEAIVAATERIDDRSRGIAVVLFDLLAQGDPVSAAQLAARTRQPEAVVRGFLQDSPGIFRDDDGRVVGFCGLAIPEMAHRFRADGGKQIHAWCALDPFLIVPLIGRSAHVESKDPITGESITMTVTPRGIEDLLPPTAVVSFIAPRKAFDFDVIETFCNYVLNFASPESAERWASERDGIVLLKATEAFEVGRRAWSTWVSRPHHS